MAFSILRLTALTLPDPCCQHGHIILHAAVLACKPQDSLCHILRCFHRHGLQVFFQALLLIQTRAGIQYPIRYHNDLVIIPELA